jgi:lysine 6-dehydrogenase
MTGMRCLVLGAGVVGEAAAWDLTQMRPGAEVTVADVSETRLSIVGQRLGVRTLRLDVTDAARVREIARQHDVVVGALPSTLGYATLRTLCEAGVRCCDVSFMPEDAATLDPLARAHGAVVVYDCGVAPGLSHVLVGAAAADLAHCDRVRIDVGGVPEHPQPPFFYKAPFAPLDVIEEYTRPVHLIAGGQATVVAPLTGVDILQVDGVGRLEAFYTDGLRSLVRTVRAGDMGERTLRHPGHLAVVAALSHAGFFDAVPRDVNGQRVRPRDLTAALLLPHWQYDTGEPDITVLQVEVTGRSGDGAPRRHAWTMVDRPQPSISGTLSSMARTTGSPAAIVARWLADGTFGEAGAHPPETIGVRGLAPMLIAALAERGVVVRTG